MRSGACAVQQTLTAEAASVLKHSLGLARRRGHAQVTPLHVAATLLSSRASSLRRACLKSQPHQTSHPLHCRALELCFNVALNRLPTTPGPLLHGQPSLSNALIAALKRAQAHQRRGCIEQQQQQPLLTIKVELEQLIISILDDPSVSRVMREAGFSSTTVKNNIEDCSSSSSVFQCYNTSGGIFSSPSSPSPPETQSFWQTRLFAYSTAHHNPVLFSPPKRIPISRTTHSDLSFKDDIKLVLDIFLRKNGNRKNTVIVGDSLSVTEGLVAELKGKCERGELHEELKVIQFIKFPFAPVSLRFMKREQVELNLSELKTKLDSLTYGGGGAIIYTGDLKWTVDIATQGEKERDGEICGGYNAVDHVVAELGRLVHDYDQNSNSKVWLMAAATYQTYMRCQMRQPSLETQWALQAVPVPSSGGLGLSLHASSVQNARIASPQNPSRVPELKHFGGKEEADALACCEECASNYEKEAQQFKLGQDKILPAWLQSHATKPHQKDELIELRKKWNRLCHCLHRSSYSQTHLSSSLYNNQNSVGKNHSTSSYPRWSTPQNTVSPDSGSISFGDSNYKHSQSLDLVPRFRRQKSCTLEFNFSGGIFNNKMTGPRLDSPNSSDGKEVTIALALGNSVLNDSGKMVEMKTERTIQRAHTCRLLQDNVPWQSETIPSIAEALIDSRSAKQNITWLLIQGNDFVGKRRLACAVAESVFGSADLLLHLNMKKKDPASTPYSELLSRAFKSHEKLVVLVEDVELADPQFKKFLADGHEGGKFGETKGLGAIFILTKNGSRGYEEHQSLQENFAIKLMLRVKETKRHLDTGEFGNKRKAEWEFLTRIKNPRIEEKDETVRVKGCRNSKKDFSRQSSFSNLDLNIRADEDYGESEDEIEDNSPNSSDLTREYAADTVNANSFLDIIENKFVFDLSPARDREMTEVFVSKIKRSFEEVYGKQQLVNFSIEDGVLKEVLTGSGFFTNNLFEKWLKDIFQSSLQMANFGGKEGGIEYKLCLSGKEDRILTNGFMGSCLPKNVQVTYME